MLCQFTGYYRTPGEIGSGSSLIISSRLVGLPARLLCVYQSVSLSNGCLYAVWFVVWLVGWLVSWLVGLLTGLFVRLFHVYLIFS